MKSMKSDPWGSTMMAQRIQQIKKQRRPIPLFISNLMVQKKLQTNKHLKSHTFMRSLDWTLLSRQHIITQTPCNAGHFIICDSCSNVLITGSIRINENFMVKLVGFLSLLLLLVEGIQMW